MSWAEIKKAVNSDLDVPLNEQHDRKVFLSDGIFKVPKGINRLHITAIACGNDGGSFTGVTTAAVGAKGGNAGESFIGFIDVVEGEEIEITVGEGNTLIGEYITLLKGGGATGTAGVSYSGTPSEPSHEPECYLIPNNTITIPTGAGRTSSSTVYAGISCSTPNKGFGQAGCGAVGKSSYSGGAAPSSPPDAKGYGCGGHGAAAHGYNTSLTVVGGKGSQGIVIIEW